MPNQLYTSILSSHEINNNLIQQWLNLESRALEPNAFLSPCFVLPALKHLTPHIKPIFIIVEKKQKMKSTLMAIGAFHMVHPSRQLPMPHLSAYRSIHGFLTGILIDKDYCREIASAFFRFLKTHANRFNAVLFERRTRGSKLDHLLISAATEYRIKWYEYHQTARAMLKLDDCGEPYLQKILSSKKKRDYRRKMRRLSELGDVKWHLLYKNQVCQKHIETFLTLENKGWKGAQRTSLASSKNQKAFFREMIDFFNLHSGTFFTEMMLDNQVIVSTANLISGRAGFGFKIGWHTDYAKMSPGILNELELIRQPYEILNDIDYIDSGATQGSYIDHLWIHRRIVASGVFTLSKPAKALCTGHDVLRRIKQRFR